MQENETIRFQTQLLIFDESRVYGRHFIVPDEIVRKMTEERTDKRVIINIDGHADMHAGMMPKKDYFFILLNKQNCTQFGIDIGDQFTVDIRPDDSKYGMMMPRELEEYLLQDEILSHYFEMLTPGKKRSLIHIIAKLKSTDKRIEKSHIIAQHLKRRRGMLDFKELNEDFKKGF